MGMHFAYMQQRSTCPSFGGVRAQLRTLLEERMAGDKVRIAAVGDIHCTRSSQGAFQDLFNEVNQAADVLLLLGDLTDYGLPEEAHVLVKELSALRVPVLGVLGNHDHESGNHVEIFDILCEA